MSIKTLSAAVLLCVSLLTSAAAWSDRAITVSATINPVFYSQCALDGQGEFIDATGEIHIVLKDDAIPSVPGTAGVSPGDNGFFIRGWNLTGTGRTTGHEYRLVDAIHEVAHTPGDGSASNWFFSIRANFIDAGSDGSHTQLIQTFRLVMVDGVPRVDVFNSVLECRG